MALLNNPYIIDIIIGLFLIIYTFIGYLKGFIIRLYDFFSLFIAYFLTINFSFPLSKLITLYQLEGLLEPIGIKVNQLLVAVILFIVGYFILKGIGVLLKPFLKKIVSLLKMTKLLDHLLGLILSIIEGIIIVYFVLSMIFIPFINQGKETIEQTYIGSFIIDFLIVMSCLGVIPSPSAISKSVGSRPSSKDNVVYILLYFLILSVMCTGILIVLELFDIALIIVCFIHQVA